MCTYLFNLYTFNINTFFALKNSCIIIEANKVPQRRLADTNIFTTVFRGIFNSANNNIFVKFVKKNLKLIGM